jgi:hypothetical protein
MTTALTRQLQLWVLTWLGTALSGGCPIGQQPATEPTPAMRTYCARIGMTEGQMYEALANWNEDRSRGFSKQETLLFRFGQCSTGAAVESLAEEDCWACVQAIADAVYGPG